MIAALRAVLESAVLPPGVFLLLVFGALIGLRRKKKTSTVLLMLALSLLYLISTPLVARGLAGSIERNHGPVELSALPGAAGAIVVLGCDRYSNAPEFGRDDVSACSLVRLRYAAELAAQAHLPVLISGGAPHGETVPEAEIMARVLRERFGVEPRWLEGQSGNTDENARFSAQILKADHVQDIVLVTHALHMHRAVRAFRRAGMQVTPAPTYYYSVRSVVPAYLTILPSMQALLISTLALREQLAFFWYVATGR